MTTREFSCTYDPSVDAFYLCKPVEQKGRVRTTIVRDGVHIDFDDKGRFVGLELLDASFHLPAEMLAQTPEPDSWDTLAEAAMDSGLSPATLRVLVNRGRVPGKKLGRDWLIDGVALWNYLEQREARGRQPASPKGRRLRAKQLASR